MTVFNVNLHIALISMLNIDINATDSSIATGYCFKLLDISIKIPFLKFTCAFPKDMIVLDLFCKKT